MKTYSDYENLIVERLQSAGIEVSPLPLIDELNVSRTLVKPRIYVIFTGSAFEATPNLGTYSQEETLNFELYIMARTRGGDNGLFEVAEEAIQRILKWKLPDATRKISVTSFGYVDGIQNNWQYVLKFAFPRVRIMREEPEETGFIRKITTKIAEA
jgi:hypothetical protein